MVGGQLRDDARRAHRKGVQSNDLGPFDFVDFLSSAAAASSSIFFERSFSYLTASWAMDALIIFRRPRLPVV